MRWPASLCLKWRKAFCPFLFCFWELMPGTKNILSSPLLLLRINYRFRGFCCCRFWSFSKLKSWSHQLCIELGPAKTFFCQTLKGKFENFKVIEISLHLRLFVKVWERIEIFLHFVKCETWQHKESQPRAPKVASWRTGRTRLRTLLALCKSPLGADDLDESGF